MLLKHLYFCGSSRKHHPTVIEELCHQFSLDDLTKSTNNFRLRIYNGGSGIVYKGCLEFNGVTDYAIALKRIYRNSDTTFFKNEIEILCQLNHPNLVSLIGFCDHKDEKILVYEYVSNGSLDKHLGDSIMEPLSWKKRLEICIGIARGLHYLHSGTKCTIFHRDIKPNNILLDDNMVPKLTDFSVSLRGPHFRSKPKPIQAELAGTIGYVAPELFIEGTFTDKSDVYSFGMLLLKTVCEMRPAEMIDLPFVEEYIYPILKGKIASECWKIFMDIVKRCSKSDPNDRPIIGEVEVELEHALSLQEEADIRNVSGYYTLLSTTIIERLAGREPDIDMESETDTDVESDRTLDLGLSLRINMNGQLGENMLSDMESSDINSEVFQESVFILHSLEVL